MTGPLKLLGRAAALWPALPRYNPKLTRRLAGLRDADFAAPQPAAPHPRPEGGTAC